MVEASGSGPTPSSDLRPGVALAHCYTSINNLMYTQYI